VMKLLKKRKIVKNIKDLKEKSELVASVEEATRILSQIEPVLNSLKNGLGLAAIQIGIPKQIGLMTKKDGSRVALINPELIEAEDEFTFINEGCLSFPDIYINTRRHRHVTIKNHVIDGDHLREEIQYFYYQPGDTNSDDLLCIQVQHEMDHFNGILFHDHQAPNVPTIINTEKKVGRNEPCPCGSMDENGKRLKYKKCCLVKA